jgi:ectoine hydroxylase-related dioxygenase (phytanoyl-CoA dioxygenase family)
VDAAHDPHGPADVPYGVTADQCETFAVDGAIVLRGVATGHLLRRVTEELDANLADPSPLAITASGADDPGRFVEDFCNWHRFPAYVQLARHVGPAIAALMGSTTVRLHHDHVLVKEAATATRTPWHQDQPYYDVEGRQMVSMWLPVDPVDRAATLEFVAGSHLGPWMMPRTFQDAQARWFPEGTLVDVPDVEADLAADPTAHRILGWALEPGDAVVFHALALHAAGGSTARRRVLSLRFLGDDAVRVERPWRTSPPIPVDAVLPVVHPVHVGDEMHD